MYFNEVRLQWTVFYPCCCCCWGSLSTRDVPFSSGPACQDDWISLGRLLQENILPALLMLKQMFKGGFLCPETQGSETSIREFDCTKGLCTKDAHQRWASETQAPDELWVCYSLSIWCSFDEQWILLTCKLWDLHLSSHKMVFQRKLASHEHIILFHLCVGFH